MSTKLNPFHLIVLLSFGLMSCNSDTEDPPYEPPTPPIQVEIANLDGTFQRIQNTQKLSITSTIPIDIAQDQLTHTRTEIETRCLSSYHTDESLHKVEFHGQNQIAVVDILPIQAFIPTRQIDPTLRCHIDMQIFIKDSLKAQINLENISIEENQSYANDNWNFLENKNQIRFQSHALKSHLLTTEINDGEASLLCEGNNQKIFFNQAEVPLAQLINNSLFNGSSLTLCRLLVRDLKAQHTRVSRSFLLQNHRPKVAQHYEYSLKADASMTLRNRPIAHLYVKNISQAVAYIKYANNRSSVNLTPVYFNNSNTKFIKAPRLSLPAIWQVAEVSKFDVVHSAKSVDILKLEPGDTLIFQLLAQKDVSCYNPPSQLNMHGWPSGRLCGRIRILAGIISQIANGPKLEMNAFSDFNSPEWNTLPITSSNNQSHLSSENFWVFNEGSKNLCIHLPSISNITEMTILEEPNPNLQIKCNAL